MQRIASYLVAVAGLMGAAGVGLAAWAAHRSGGDTLMTAALLLTIHASAVAAIGLSGRSRGVLAAGGALALGAVLFTGDLALRLTVNIKPWALAAPTGGVVMILGWLGLSLVAFLAMTRQKSAARIPDVTDL